MNPCPVDADDVDAFDDIGLNRVDAALDPPRLVGGDVVDANQLVVAIEGVSIALVSDARRSPCCLR